MKKCTYCGKEYPDDAVRCIIDHEPLTGGETESSAAGKTSAPTSEIPLPATESPPVVFTDRQIVIFEVVILCIIAFGSNILGSWYYLFDNSAYSSSSRTEYAWAAQVLKEGACLCLLWYFLMSRGKSFSNLGLLWSWKDFGWSIVLSMAGGLAFEAVYHLFCLTGTTMVGSNLLRNDVGHLLFGGGIFFATILVQFINPFFEELIVRAYVMTEVKYLTNSVTKAVIISTVLQTSYHFYQGVPAALSHAGAFLVYSIFYAKTNRITPIILAHLYSDVGGTLDYWFRHGMA